MKSGKIPTCTFCGEKVEFASAITISYLGQDISTLSVCPDCRIRYQIVDLYKRAMKKLEGKSSA